MTSDDFTTDDMHFKATERFAYAIVAVQPMDWVMRTTRVEPETQWTILGRAMRRVCTPYAPCTDLVPPS